MGHGRVFEGNSPSSSALRPSLGKECRTEDDHAKITFSQPFINFLQERITERKPELIKANFVVLAQRVDEWLDKVGFVFRCVRNEKQHYE